MRRAFASSLMASQYDAGSDMPRPTEIWSRAGFAFSSLKAISSRHIAQQVAVFNAEATDVLDFVVGAIAVHHHAVGSAAFGFGYRIGARGAQVNAGVYSDGRIAIDAHIYTPALQYWHMNTMWRYGGVRVSTSVWHRLQIAILGGRRSAGLGLVRVLSISSAPF